MRNVIIMRGVPGSGKSTYVRNRYPEARVVSADRYFTDPATGEYRFDASKRGARSVLRRVHVRADFRRAGSGGG